MSAVCMTTRVVNLQVIEKDNTGGVVERHAQSVAINMQDQDNTPLLKILTPNMLRVGRINSRSLDGLVRLPDKYREQVEAVENIYDAWFRIWHESYLPKLIYKPKWFKTDEDLQEGDLVYFMKSEHKLSNEYTMER